MLIAITYALAAVAQVTPGDLDGDGDLDVDDEALLPAFYGLTSADPGWEPAADLNADGAVNHLDLSLFGAGYGSTGGEVDTDPPVLLVTLNDIPDDMNDLLVVPPAGFQVTLLVDSAGGSVVDTTSLSVTLDRDFGPHPASTGLASLFSVTPTRALWDTTGAAPDIANYYVDVSISDAAGNLASDSYGFAVRNFGYGAPLGQLNTVFLDFDEDRGIGTFVEDLRDFGLSSTADPTVEQIMFDRVTDEVVGRANAFYGRAPDGSPLADAANVVFVGEEPGSDHTLLCVGGQSTLGGSFLGAAPLDVNNGNPYDQVCGLSGQFGVFPQAIDNLWGGNAEYLATFSPLRASLGGTPVGEHALDPIVTDPGFDPGSATMFELARYEQIENGVEAFAQVTATASAHETGHLLGLVAHDPAPGGLYGGDSGANTDHNVTAGGYTPSDNWLMNQGGAFTFDEMTGRNGDPLPRFRPLGWAYLRDRIALNSQVTGLFPPPVVTSVTPNPVSYSGQNATIFVHGADFLATPIVELLNESFPTARDVNNEVWLDPNTVQGTINKFVVLEGYTYDVRVTNPDGQIFVLPAAVTVE